jgi:hypothetical protein
LDNPLAKRTDRQTYKKHTQEKSAKIKRDFSKQFLNKGFKIHFSNAFEFFSFNIDYTIQVALFRKIPSMYIFPKMI